MQKINIRITRLQKQFVSIILFCLLGVSIASTQTLDWVYTAGGTGDDRITASEVGTDGSIYIAGSYQGTIDLDFGSGVSNLTSNGQVDMFLAKYDSDGLLLWANSFGGSANENITSIALDGSNNVYISGEIRSATDFDPGLGTTTLTPNNSSDVIFAKYGSDGSLTWANILLGNGAERVSSIALDNSDNIILYGSFNATIDLDPGAGVNNPTRAGSFDLFFSKYDNAGNFIWGKSIGSSLFELGADMEVDAAGRIYLSGIYFGDGDFDPDAGTTTLTHVGDQDCFFGKYDTDGSLLWVHGFSSVDNEVITDIALNGSGDVFITGGFRNTIDFDPSAGVSNRTSVSGADIILAKYDTNGLYIESFSLGGIANDFGIQIQFDSDDKLTLIGRFQSSFDFDKSERSWILSSNSPISAYVLRLEQNLDFISATPIQIENGSTFELDFDIHLLDGENYLLSGFFSNTGDFNPDDNVSNRTSNGGEDIFIAKYSQDYIPAIGSLNITQQANSEMILSSEITDIGDTYIVASGIIYDTVSNLTLSSSIVTEEQIVNSTQFTSTLTDLIEGDTYYASPYVINSQDTAIGSAISFIAPYELPLDGNQDGIFDTEQPHIHTLLSIDQKTYITLRAAAGDTLYDVQNYAYSDSEFIYPWGLSEFKLNKASAEVDLIFHGQAGSDDYSYRKKNPFDKVVDFSGFRLSNALVGSQSSNIVTLSLADGGAGDFDGERNGVIYDPGGLAISNIDATIPVWDWWWVLVLMGSGWLAWRKLS